MKKISVHLRYAVVYHNHSEGNLITVTSESISLIELTKNHANAGFMRETGKWALHRLMELEVESQIGAGRHERNDELSTPRNGCR